MSDVSEPKPSVCIVVEVFSLVCLMENKVNRLVLVEQSAAGVLP